MLFLNFRCNERHPVSLDVVFEESQTLYVECTLLLECECLGIKADSLATWFDRAYIFSRRESLDGGTALTASKDENRVTLIILSKFANLSRDISDWATSIA